VPAHEDLLRELAPQVLGTLVRRHGRFEDCEDAVQEAVLAATVQWPAEGVPDNPRGWLTTVASRRLVDQMRSDHARRERESAATIANVVPEGVPDTDDTLVLLFLCCHPALTAASQTALTLRAVGGLTTAEIARAFLVPEATMAARISRAKQRIKAAGSSFSLPGGTEREERLRVVLHVLYLIFNEGYTASAGSELHCADLAHEAIRQSRMRRRCSTTRSVILQRITSGGATFLKPKWKRPTPSATAVAITRRCCRSICQRRHRHVRDGVDSGWFPPKSWHGTVYDDTAGVPYRCLAELI